MRKDLIILVSSVLFFAASLRGQCPDRDSLWRRMIYLRDTSKLPFKEQLQEFLPHLDRMSNCPYKNDSIHALLFKRIGALYYKLGDFTNALEYYRQYINIIVTNAGKPSVDMGELLGGYYWLSAIYDSLNMINEKWKAQDSCVDIAEKIGKVNRANLFSMYTRIVSFFDIGDYYRCVEYAMRCETLGKIYANANSGVEYKTGLDYTLISLLWRVEALLILKDYRSAEDLLINKADECKKNGFNDYLGMVYKQLADLEEHKGNYNRALEFLNQSLNCYRGKGFEFNRKQILNTIGLNIYFKHFKDDEKALAYYRNAIKLENKVESNNKDDAFENLNLFSNIANVYVRKGLYDSAFHYFKLALNQIKEGLNESAILESSPEEFSGQEKIYYRINLMIDKGNAYRQFYGVTGQRTALDEALRIYKVTDQLLDRIRTELTEFQSKLFWRSYSQRLYENAIEACYLNNDTSEAFYFFEKSRAVLLFDQLNEQRLLAQKDILKQSGLQKKIQQVERDLNKADPNSEKFNELQREMFIKKRELVLLKGQMKSNNPHYYKNYLQTNAVTLKDVRERILNNHQALVELFAGDSAVYAMILTQQQSKLVKINKAEYDRLSLDYITYISDRDSLNRNFVTFQKTARSLYELIFQNEVIPPGRIIISPDGHYFPFESLIVSESGMPPKYFVENYAVSYTFSARYLLNLFNKTAGEVSRDFMGIAPLQYYASFRLAELAGSEISLQKLQSHFRKSDQFIAENATRKNFMDNFNQHKIIQLYTHATDSGTNGEPMIYFVDSTLALSDLFYENKPVTSLIVLAACETASGKLFKGEGVFSFSRGFAALGIPSSVTNLWSVENQSTYRLTELFFKHLSKGLPIDVAMQRAKIEFLQTATKEKKLPYYWAAPILAGQSDAIVIKKPIPWKYIALAGIAAIAVFGWWVWKRKRRPSISTLDTMGTAA